jgi:hypothetical protein
MPVAYCPTLPPIERHRALRAAIAASQARLAAAVVVRRPASRVRFVHAHQFIRRVTA